MAVSLLRAWRRFSKDNTNLQQFGQGDDESTFNGATGCTHTIWQRIIKAYTGKYYSHDQLSHIAGYPWPVDNKLRRGMVDSESQRIIKHFGLPYKRISSPSWQAIIDATAKGPVVTGIMYGYWPEMVGAVYLGEKADGRPGGYAYRNGKTQLRGAEGIRHAILVLGDKMVNGTRRIFANEPNHGSPSRKEKPDYDAVKNTHAKRAYEKFNGTRFAYIPTRTVRPKGY